MMLMLRSVRLGIVAMIPNLIPLFVAGALIRLLGRPLDLGTAMVASVALGICIDDTSQILANYSRVRRDGLEPRGRAAAGDGSLAARRCCRPTAC